MSSINNNSTNPVMTDLYQLVYISCITSTGLSGASTLNDIAEASTKNNKVDDITGVLCYGNGYFFQCVEGSEQVLTNLKNRLLIDDRHKDLQILEFSAITERRFKDWWLRSIILERWMTTEPEVKALNSWSADEKQQFLDILQSYYEEREQTGDSDMQPIKYNALGLTLSKVVGQHQAFFLIQAVLGLLIVLTLLWFMLSGNF